MKIRSYTIIQLKDLTEVQAYQSVTLSTLLTANNISYTISQDSLIASLFQKINDRFNKFCLFELPTDEASEENVNANMRDWLVKFINQYENTKTYYETLIKKFNAVESKLMDDIEATNENEVIFNDTPQTSGGIFKTTDYATTYTKTSSKSKTPMKTPIERLKDLQDNLRNLWKDWLDKFHELFIEVQEGGLFYEI